MSLSADPDPNQDEINILVRISACVACRDESKLQLEIHTALQQKLSVTLIRETILQTYLFTGYAATINAFIVLNETVESAEGFIREEQRTLELWKERGDELCRKIYGSQYDKLVQNMNRLHPDLAEWMVWEGYGKVLCRPFLSPLVRELLIIAMTAVLQVERQFYSHVRGALHVGANAEQITSVFKQVDSFLSPDATARFQSILNTILSE